jgi:hypothetical protein
MPNELNSLEVVFEAGRSALLVMHWPTEARIISAITSFISPLDAILDPIPSDRR